MTVFGEFGWPRRPLHGSGSETIAQITPLRRTGGPLNQAVYDVLRERLLEGRYPVGTRLPTDDLRAELGVSKQPVMEALRRLAADGMVQIVPQVGCLVAGYDLHEVEDFYLALKAASPAPRRFGGPTSSSPSSARSLGRSVHCAASAMPRSGRVAIGCGIGGSTMPSARWRSHG
jgi:DNA-binding transcriptional MocR family regulator